MCPLISFACLDQTSRYSAALQYCLHPLCSARKVPPCWARMFQLMSVDVVVVRGGGSVMAIRLHQIIRCVAQEEAHMLAKGDMERTYQTDISEHAPVLGPSTTLQKRHGHGTSRLQGVHQVVVVEFLTPQPSTPLAPKHSIRLSTPRRKLVITHPLAVASSGCLQKKSNSLAQ